MILRVPGSNLIVSKMIQHTLRNKYDIIVKLLLKLHYKNVRSDKSSHPNGTNNHNIYEQDEAYCVLQ